MRSKREIEKQKGEVFRVEDGDRPGYFGMSYEDGVLAALDWVDETVNDEPMPEEE